MARGQTGASQGGAGSLPSPLLAPAPAQAPRTQLDLRHSSKDLASTPSSSQEGIRTSTWHCVHPICSPLIFWFPFQPDLSALETPGQAHCLPLCCQSRLPTHPPGPDFKHTTGQRCPLGVTSLSTAWSQARRKPVAGQGSPPSQTTSVKPTYLTQGRREPSFLF